MAARCSIRVARAYDALVACTGGLAEARGLFRWAVDMNGPPAEMIRVADMIAPQAKALAVAAREYAAALRADAKGCRRGR